MRLVKLLKSSKSKQRGSLALEQVLFIGAIVAMSSGIYAFYDEIGNYFSTFSVANVKPGSTNESSQN